MPDLSVIKNLFDFQEFGPLYRALDPSVERWWFNRFFKPLPKQQTVTKTVRVLSVASNQTPGKLNLAGAPHVRQPVGYSDTAHTIVRQADRIELTDEIILGLQTGADKWRRMTAMQLLEQKILDMKRAQYLLMEAMLAHMFIYHRLNFDSQNRLLSPSVDATTGAITNNPNSFINIDFGVADRNRGNLNSAISAQWSTAGTDIQAQLAVIDKAQAARGAPPIKEIHINVLDRKHIMNNTLFKTWAAADPAIARSIYAGNVVQGLFGKNWFFHSESYTDPVGGTTIDLIPQNYALFVPDNGPWLRAYEGMEPMDKGTGQSRFQDAQAALDDMVHVPGEFGFIWKDISNPTPSYWQNGINNWGELFADPNAPLCGKVFTN